MQIDEMILKMRVLLILIFSVGWGLGAEFCSRNYLDGSSMVARAPLGGLMAGGFTPLVVEVENKGDKIETWAIDATVDQDVYEYRIGYRSYEGNLSGSWNLSCPPGETRRIDILVPTHVMRIDHAHGSGDRRLMSLEIRRENSNEVVGGYLDSAETGVVCSPKVLTLAGLYSAPSSRA